MDKNEYFDEVEFNKYRKMYRHYGLRLQIPYAPYILAFILTESICVVFSQTIIKNVSFLPLSIFLALSCMLTPAVIYLTATKCMYHGKYDPASYKEIRSLITNDGLNSQSFKTKLNCTMKQRSKDGKLFSKTLSVLSAAFLLPIYSALLDQQTSDDLAVYLVLAIIAIMLVFSFLWKTRDFYKLVCNHFFVPDSFIITSLLEIENIEKFRREKKMTELKNEIKKKIIEIETQSESLNSNIKEIRKLFKELCSVTDVDDSTSAVSQQTDNTANNIDPQSNNTNENKEEQQ